MIGLICAMEKEASKVRKQISKLEKSTFLGLEFAKGLLDGKEVVLVRCGVGKVNAAYATATMLAIFNPDIVINFGVCGALNMGYQIGDIIVADRVFQYDYDISPFDVPPGYIEEIEAIFLEPMITDLDAAKKAAQSNGINLQIATIGSGDKFMANPDEAMFINEQYMVPFFEMEGAAIAQVAKLSGKRWLVIRSISDYVGGEATDYHQGVTTSMASLSEYLLAVIKEVK